MRFFIILLISVLFVFNCSKDNIISPVPDPSEPLWGNWWGIKTWTETFSGSMGGEYERSCSDEHVFVFKPDGIFLYYYKATSGYNVLITGNDSEYLKYRYDPARKVLIISFDDFITKEPLIYDGGDSFILWGLTFTKQDTLPDWATY